MKLFLHRPLFLIITFVLSYSISSAQQIRATYVKAAQLYRDAAAKTKCPERASYFNRMAAYNDCLAKSLETGAKVTCSEPAGGTPGCPADAMEGSGDASSSNAAITAGNSVEQRAKQTQMELANASSASLSAYENAINNGKKASGALVESALAGGQMISDPKTSLTYTGINLGLAGVAYLSERKEAKRMEKLEELKKIKESLNASSTVLDFISGATTYNVTDLLLETKKNGRLKSITRNDKYSISTQIHEVINTADNFTIYESVSFTNLITKRDSCIISKIVVPFYSLETIKALNGNYTNRYSVTNGGYSQYRYKRLDNKEIEFAFTMSGDFPELPSGLTDVYITSKIPNIKIYKKLVSSKPYSIKEGDFADVKGYLTDKYLMVFDDYNDKIKDFVDYLNYFKD